MKKALWIILPLFIAIAFLPEILSSPLGKSFFNQAFSSKFHATASIQTIRLNWLGPQHFQNITLINPEMKGEIKELKSAAPLWQLNSIGNDFTIIGGNFSFPARGQSLNDVSVELHNHNLSAQGRASPEGSFSLRGKVFTQNDFDISYELSQIPTTALDQYFNTDHFIHQALGDVLDAQGSLLLHENKGEFTLDLSSPHLSSSLRANLDSKWLTLKDPFKASFQLTQQFASTWLSQINPLFLTGVESKNPITLEIEPEGFRFPWRPFNLKELKIKQATLDMGKIQCDVGPTLSSLISLFKNFRKSDQAEIWFTPLNFSIDQELIKTSRMDALISNAIHICTWGSIDCANQKLDMILGICADTLNQSFGIRGLPSNYVLKMALQGTPQEPDLDTKSATAKIAALIAAEQIPKFGGKKGQLIGGVINKITQSQENQDDVPPPKRPFPWER